MSTILEKKRYDKIIKLYKKLKPKIENGTISNDEKKLLINFVKKIEPHKCNKLEKKLKPRLPSIKENILF